MEQLLERARALLDDALARARRELPPGAEVFDAHVHVGTDIDGFRAPLDHLLSFLDGFDAVGAFAFCLDEPDRAPGFRAANDRTLDAARSSDGVLVPFARLDLADGPVAEAERALDAGARGIKLHPRAQSFSLGDARLDPIFAISAERGVPILVHGGRGLPPIGSHLARLAERHPAAQLIVAHAGIADLRGMASALAGRPGLFFDTSVWSGLDLLDLFSRVGPEQVVYASDFPYGQQPGSLLLTLRMARAAGLDDDEVRALLGGTAVGIAAGATPPTPSAPRGRGRIDQSLTFARIHHYLAMCSPLLWTRQADAIGVVGLALNTCGEAGEEHEALERIAELLTVAGELWRESARQEDAGERWRLAREVMRLVHVADVEALSAVG